MTLKPPDPNDTFHRHKDGIYQKLFFLIIVSILMFAAINLTSPKQTQNINSASAVPCNNNCNDPNFNNTVTTSYISQTNQALGTEIIAPQNTHAFYVSPDGNDNGNGSINLPWKSLATAVKRLQSGDILFIRGGLYQESLEIKNSGSKFDPIVISGFENEEVIIDGVGNTLPSIDHGTPLVSIIGDWIEFRNIAVQYSGDLGVYSIGKHVTIDHVFVHHNRGSGVILSGDFNLIQNSRIWYNSTVNENNQSKTGWGSGVSCARFPDFCTIKNSVVWENWGEGISIFEALHSAIEGNVSYDNQQNIYLSDTKYSTVQGNLSYCSPGNSMDSYTTQNGILVGDEKGVPIPLGINGPRNSSSNNMIINNIVVGCNHNLSVDTDHSSSNLYANNTFVDSAGSTREKINVLFFKGKANDSSFVNNIIIQNDNRSIAFVGGSGITFNNNIWSKKPPNNLFGKGNQVNDPLFIKEGNPFTAEWYRIKPESPAIDAGLLLTEVKMDFFGVDRGTNPDVGAVEFQYP
jgi:hypothetical protein